MLLYRGMLSHENMQIEGFWYYLFLGSFEAATIYYAVAKIFGPLLLGRGCEREERSVFSVMNARKPALQKHCVKIYFCKHWDFPQHIFLKTREKWLCEENPRYVLMAESDLSE